ncbi:hypothetical protein CPB85DRAFT_1434772 [Mucidula mucida]|nr:hypothetical protein CPB85DRAFT_1434772 [Mucidula mucida]
MPNPDIAIGQAIPRRHQSPCAHLGIASLNVAASRAPTPALSSPFCLRHLSSLCAYIKVARPPISFPCSPAPSPHYRARHSPPPSHTAIGLTLVTTIIHIALPPPPSPPQCHFTTLEHSPSPPHYAAVNTHCGTVLLFHTAYRTNLDDHKGHVAQALLPRHTLAASPPMRTSGVTSWTSLLSEVRRFHRSLAFFHLYARHPASKVLSDRYAVAAIAQ